MLDSYVHAGLYPSAQLFVSLHGKIIINHAVGEARQGVRMTIDTKGRLDCAGKPVLALGVLWLTSRKLLSLDMPVSSYIPEFGCGNKEKITVRHLLTNTAGLFTPAEQGPYRTSPSVLNRILLSGSIGDVTPGTIAAYDIWGGWYTLAMLIERVATVPWDQFLNQQVLEPMGASAFALVPGSCDRSQYELPYRSVGRHRPIPVHYLDRPEILAYPNPAYGAYAAMQTLALIYETLADKERCADILGIDTDFMRLPQRPELYDETLRRRCSMAFGMWVNLKTWNYSPRISAEAFGMHSHAGTWGFSDPAIGLAVGLRINGAVQEMSASRRAGGGNPVINAIYHTIADGH